MHLHIGGDYTVRKSEIVGIMDIENTSVSKITREYFKNAEKSGKVINVSSDLPKSFIITESKKEIKVYISPISSATLLRRATEKGGY